MNDWLPAAALTFAGSAHCFGMCGGLMVTVAARGTRSGALRDFLLLQLGKGTTYAFLGSLAGLLGSALVNNPWFTLASRGLAVVAAVALASAGLTLLGRGAAIGRWTTPFASLWSRALGPLLQARPAGFPVVVGLSMGLLPCPLIYAGLAVAAATASPLHGALTLAGVALGSIPALALATLATKATGIASPMRPFMARAAGVLLIIVAVVTLSRAVPGGHDHTHVNGEVLCAPASRLSRLGPCLDDVRLESREAV